MKEGIRIRPIRAIAYCLSAACLSAPYAMAAGSAASQPEAPFKLQSATPLVELNKRFQNDALWCGGDGAETIPLNDGNLLWLFADSFVHHQMADGTSPKAFVNNTVAKQNLSTHALRFFWKTNAGGDPAAIFTPRQEGAWYWPADGFLVDGRLYVVNKLMVKKASPDEMFSFDWIGDELIQITNPSDSPIEWKQTVTALPELSKTVLIGTACFVDSNYVYFTTSLPRFSQGINIHPAGICRIVKTSLASLNMNAMEYWNGQLWSNNASQSAVIVQDGAPEMTVTRLRGEPYLVMTYMPILSANIYLRFALKPEGPWSKPISVYHCPESSITILDRKVMVYGARDHAELASRKDELVISYCSNPGMFKHHEARPDIYFPRLISVKLQRANGDH